MKAALAAAFAGLLFALGLGIGGMTQPEKVVGFLDVAGRWDASLVFVMVGALAVHAGLRPLILRRRAPVLSSAFPEAPPARLDAGLCAGAAIFGVGWGLSGYCPGPAVTSMASGHLTPILFVASMLAGMALFGWLSKRPSQECS